MEQKDVKKDGSVFVYSDDLAWFDFGSDHPFKPERAAKTYELCSRYGVMNHPWMEILKPKSIDPSLLTLFHEPEYLRLLEKASRGEVEIDMLARGIGTQDNPILPGILDWSLKVAGGTNTAMNRLIHDDALIAFNPLGGFHHAGSGRAEGFCYINDIVIAIKSAIEIFPDLKIAYVDIDAHHGNGVQEAFYDDPGVLVISIHETGRVLYPFSGYESESGEGIGIGYTVNIPMEPGSDDEVFSLLFNETIIPILDSFSPDIIVAELGADTMISDPLTHLKLTNNSYLDAVKKILKQCPKILALGGGGYDIFRTARCWTLAWSILNDLEPEDEFAGLVGGMMFGPEMEVGSLYDHPYSNKSEDKEKALMEGKRVMTYIKENIFPIHGIK